MTMTIQVKTTKNEDYIFTQKDGKTFFQGSFMIAGEVTKLHNKLKLGEKIRMDFRKEKLYGAAS